MFNMMNTVVTIIPGQHTLSNRALTFNNVNELRWEHIPARISNKSEIIIYRADITLEVKEGYVIKDESDGSEYTIRTSVMNYPEYFKAQVDIKSV